MTKAKLASSAFGRLIGSKPQEYELQKFKNKRQQGASLTVQGDLSNPCCYYCKKRGHLLEKCYSFRNEKFEARKEFVRKEKLCNVCFGKGHLAKQCRRRDNCLVAECGQRHHSLLHPVQSSATEEPKKDVEKGPSTNLQNEKAEGHCSATGAGRPGVRLRVIPVKVRGLDRTQEIETYALLDDGSDVSLCDIDLVKHLGITGVPTRFSLTTVNDGT